MADDDVTAKTGVYSYVPGGERVLSIRKFREADRRAAFERQNRICPACGKAFADVERATGPKATTEPYIVRMG